MAFMCRKLTHAVQAFSVHKCKIKTGTLRGTMNKSFSFLLLLFPLEFILKGQN